MPIILAPAYDVNTLNTVVQRIVQVPESFNQKHVVLTVDQALFFPATHGTNMGGTEYQDCPIPRHSTAEQRK